MADGTEDLKIVVRAVDEASATLAKVSAKVDQLESGVTKMRDQTRRAMDDSSKSALKLGDAFGFIIKRSPILLLTDFAARVVGGRNAMDLLNKAMDVGATAFRDFGRQMLGADVEGEKFEKRIKSIREQFDALDSRRKAREGIVGFGETIKLGPYAPTVAVPENIRGLEEAGLAILQAQAKLERLNQTTHEGRERFLEQNDILERLNDQLATMSQKADAAAVSQKKVSEAAKENARVTEEWNKKSWWGGGSVKDFMPVLEFSADAFASIFASVSRAPQLGSNIQSFFTSAAQGAEMAWPALQKVASAIGEVNAKSERDRAQLVSDVERMRSFADPFADRGTGETTEQKIAAINALEDAQRQLNETTREHADLWTDIGIGMKQGAGWVISNMLFDLQNGRDILEGMLRNLLSIGNQVAGQWLGNQLFGSASGNVFSGGNVVPFARGGIVGGPSTFPMSDGRTGLMGEAGPEAIVPLAKTRGGKLGIESTGGGRAVSVSLSFVSLDPSRAADVVMQSDVWDAITSRLAAAISTGENMALRTAVAGAR